MLSSVECTPLAYLAPTCSPKHLLGFMVSGTPKSEVSWTTGKVLVKSPLSKPKQ